MKAKQFFYILTGLLIVIVVGGLMAFWLGHRQLDVRINNLNKLSTDLVIENQEIARLKKLEAEYKEIEPLADRVSSFLPDQKEQDQVVAQVAKIVGSHGLALDGLDFDKTTGLPNERSQTQASKIGGIFIMPVRFQTLGSYQQLQALLGSFEKQQRFMRVSTLDLSRTEKGDITAGVVLEVFFRP